MAAQLGPMSQQLGAMAPEEDTMDIDIDIDMDADVEPIPEPELEEGEEYEITPFNVPVPNTLVPAIYHDDPDQEIQPTKVHVRGIDDLSTDDVISFASEHWPTSPAYVQWIDDTSANLVYPSSIEAVEALAALCDFAPTIPELLAHPLQLRDTKPRQGCRLQVRRAIASDKKRRNAKDASRYYLLHPELDPIERMRAEFANGRRRRHGDRADRAEHGDYKRRSYNEREDQRRRDLDVNGEGGGDFNASMYDDEPEPRRSRSDGRGRRGMRNRSASPGRSTTNHDEIVLDDASASDANDRTSKNHRNNGSNGRSSRRFRDRSSPPLRSSLNGSRPNRNDNTRELFPSSDSTAKPGSGQLVSDCFQERQQQRQAAKAVQAAKLKKELFPNMTDRSNHRRSHAYDARAAADAANSDELSKRMSRRMGLGGAEATNVSIDPISKNSKANAGRELLPDSKVMGGGGGGLAIKGTGGFSIKGGAGISIKGAAASAANVRELFPDKYAKTGGGGGGGGGAGGGNVSGNGNGNEGRELFSDKIRGRGNLRRNKAEDLFG